LYETKPRTDFTATELAALLDPKALFVVFSPSAARVIESCLRQHQVPLTEQSFAVIGPTTEQEVKKIWPQAAVHKAAQPNAVALRRLVAELRPEA
jgi:uroporphyrinogen-III synthase